MTGNMTGNINMVNTPEPTRKSPTPRIPWWAKRSNACVDRILSCVQVVTALSSDMQPNPNEDVSIQGHTQLHDVIAENITQKQVRRSLRRRRGEVGEVIRKALDAINARIPDHSKTVHTQTYDMTYMVLLQLWAATYGSSEGPVEGFCTYFRNKLYQGTGAGYESCSESGGGN